jgi:hypothetical protein
LIDVLLVTGIPWAGEYLIPIFSPSFFNVRSGNLCEKSSNTPLFRDTFDPSCDDKEKIVCSMTAHAIKQYYNRLLHSRNKEGQEKKT